jgi:phage shock protein C
MSKGYKQLYRSREGRMIGGVCAGLGDYFGIDPTLIRLVFVLGALLTGVGAVLLIYIIMLIVVPEEPLSVETYTANPAV